ASDARWTRRTRLRGTSRVRGRDGGHDGHGSESTSNDNDVGLHECLRGTAHSWPASGAPEGDSVTSAPCLSGTIAGVILTKGGGMRALDRTIGGRIMGILAVSLFALWAALRAAETDLPLAKPEAVGVSSARLDRVKSFIKDFIDANRIAGA